MSITITIDSQSQSIDASALDHEVAAHLHQHLAGQAEPAQHIVIDCAGADYISSVGMGALIQIQMEHAPGTLAIRNPGPVALPLLSMVFGRVALGEPESPEQEHSEEALRQAAIEALQISWD